MIFLSIDILLPDPTGFAEYFVTDSRKSEKQKGRWFFYKFNIQILCIQHILKQPGTQFFLKGFIGTPNRMQP